MGYGLCVFGAIVAFFIFGGITYLSYEEQDIEFDIFAFIGIILPSMGILSTSVILSLLGFVCWILICFITYPYKE